MSDAGEPMSWLQDISADAIDAAHPMELGGSDMVDIVDRLKEACNGHPAAKIPWPHRLLHDAIAEIERLRALALSSQDRATT